MSPQTDTDSCARLITPPPSQRSDRRPRELGQPVSADEAAGFVLDWELSANASVAAPVTATPPGDGAAGVRPRDPEPTGPGEASATTRPVLSVTVTREMGTVVATLEGRLDEESSSAVAGVLWDLVVGQGNLSVAVDVRRLSFCDPSLTAVCTVLEREAARMGGTLTVVAPSPPPPSTDDHRAPASLDPRRARRAARLGMTDHPAGGARKTHRTTRGSAA